MFETTTAVSSASQLTSGISCAPRSRATAVCAAASADSYLNQQNILAAALATGAQAIHPGYGFLSENAAFARLCKEQNLAFIGPDGDIISKMGDKDAARRLMKEAGVPTVPGSELLESVEQARAEAARIGYPVLIKASAGGGGKGIRLVNGEEELENAFHTAAAEAEKAFGDGRVYMEKFLSPVKHIEVQLLADEQGHVVCLGERECSIQKNNQKLIEETPSSAISPALRQEMMDAAAGAAKAAGYLGAGTVEFLLDGDGRFYFIEMNTRLQVEHPVTEFVTGVDIVKWQIRIAAGIPLDFTQEDIRLTGAAIECRVNATGCGTVDFLHVPGGPWVRFDTALYQGCEVPPYYDPMIGKMIVYAGTREETIRKMADVDHKYARQSGGKGQYGHVKITIEPNEQGKGYEFINKVVGGNIPKEYIPAVDEGIRGAMQSGVLAGYNVVDVKVTLNDGSYHEVDSSEMAFKIAGSMAFKEAMRKADPVLTEPIMKVVVTTPEEYMGDVIGDLNSRRGAIQGMENVGGAQQITAMVPLSMMFGYATDMRSKTQGRGQYTMEPDHYAEVPKSIAETIASARAKKD